MIGPVSRRMSHAVSRCACFPFSSEIAAMRFAARANSSHILSTSAVALDWSKTRKYSDAAQARIQEEGLLLQVSTFSSDSGALAGKSHLSSALHRFPGTLKGHSKARAPSTNGYADSHRLSDGLPPRLRSHKLACILCNTPRLECKLENWDHLLTLSSARTSSASRRSRCS
jgi:hypothetical protein